MKSSVVGSMSSDVSNAIRATRDVVATTMTSRITATVPFIIATTPRGNNATSMTVDILNHSISRNVSTVSPVTGYSVNSLSRDGNDTTSVPVTPTAQYTLPSLVASNTVVVNQSTLYVSGVNQLNNKTANNNSQQTSPFQAVEFTGGAAGLNNTQNSHAGSITTDYLHTVKYTFDSIVVTSSWRQTVTPQILISSNNTRLTNSTISNYPESTVVTKVTLFPRDDFTSTSRRAVTVGGIVSSGGTYSPQIGASTTLRNDVLGLSDSVSSAVTGSRNYSVHSDENGSATLNNTNTTVRVTTVHYILNRTDQSQPSSHYNVTSAPSRDRVTRLDIASTIGINGADYNNNTKTSPIDVPFQGRNRTETDMDNITGSPTVQTTIQFNIDALTTGNYFPNITRSETSQVTFSSQAV